MLRSLPAPRAAPARRGPPRRPPALRRAQPPPVAAAPSPATPPPTAAAAVEAGLAEFRAGRPDAALALFEAAKGMAADGDETRAAIYNSACALTALKRYSEAADAIVEVVNEHGLKLDVAASDPDLRALRERVEWLDALEVARGGVTSGALVQARAETRAPFRALRLFLAGGLGAGAGLGLLIIGARLVSALQGGDGAPDLADTLQNFGINVAAVAVFGFVFARDFKAARADAAASAREEALARLTLALPDGRVVPAAKFRGVARPVLVCAPPAALARALRDAEPYKAELALKGVRVVPVPSDAADPGGALRTLKAELRGEVKGFGAPSPAAKKGDPAAADRGWRLEPADPAAWRAWLQDNAGAAGLAGSTFYVQIQLDGTVRASGVGAPPWASLARDLPALDSLQTKLTDGVAR